MVGVISESISVTPSNLFLKWLYWSLQHTNHYETAHAYTCSTLAADPFHTNGSSADCCPLVDSLYFFLFYLTVQ